MSPRMFILCVGLSTILVLVKGYSSGAPFDFCNYQNLANRNVMLRPGHVGIVPQNGRLGRYQIQVGLYNSATHSHRGKTDNACQ